MQGQNIPCHVAIIMDGNGRWAESRGHIRMRGHEEGGKRIEEIIRAASERGVKYLTLYAFSKENWQRPKREVEFLMNLLSDYLDRKFEELMKNDIVFNVIGQVTDLPEKVQEKIRRNKEASRQNKGLVLTFALSYSSRLEIVRACRELAEKAKQGEIQPEDIDEKLLAGHLYTADLPDPDLLIRTSGEMRISNFLLWQISYAELYITEKYWPEFTAEEFDKALAAYQERERRFGRTQPLKGE